MVSAPIVRVCFVGLTSFWSQQLCLEAADKIDLIAELYIRINKLEEDLSDQTFAVERLRTIMDEDAVHASRRGQEMMKLEDDLRLEPDARSAIQVQLDQAHDARRSEVLPSSRTSTKPRRSSKPGCRKRPQPRSPPRVSCSGQKRASKVSPPYLCLFCTCINLDSDSLPPLVQSCEQRWRMRQARRSLSRLLILRRSKISRTWREPPRLCVRSSTARMCCPTVPLFAVSAH